MKMSLEIDVHSYTLALQIFKRMPYSPLTAVPGHISLWGFAKLLLNNYREVLNLQKSDISVSRVEQLNLSHNSVEVFIQSRQLLSPFE